LIKQAGQAIVTLSGRDHLLAITGTRRAGQFGWPEIVPDAPEHRLLT
jgi:hypothetical protein